MGGGCKRSGKTEKKVFFRPPPPYNGAIYSLEPIYQLMYILTYIFDSILVTNHLSPLTSVLIPSS